MTQPEFVTALLRTDIWPDRPESVDWIETHISWVFLTRDFAWKIKKPVRFAFLDFSTLASRRHFCEEEVRLNRRTAPDLYHGVVPLTGSPAVPCIGGDLPAWEYAVQMSRFEQSQLVSNIAAAGGISDALLDALAECVAEFHETLPSSEPPGGYGTPASVEGAALENFQELAALVVAPEAGCDVLSILRRWTENEATSLNDFLAERRTRGFVRECHGDLHLGNIIATDAGPRLFDGIEFNPVFRWIDVMNEISFLVMDLERHAGSAAARRLLNRYLECSGDYSGLRALPFYLTYRAMVRAKVDALRLSDPDLPADQSLWMRRDFENYLAVAEAHTRRTSPAVVLMQGVSGSGKSVVSQRLVEGSPAIRIRSDIERKRLFGLRETQRPDESRRAAMYSPDANRCVYEHLEIQTRYVIEAGFPVIVDATFLDEAERCRFRELAERLRVPFWIAACQTDEDTLLKRVAARESANDDASDAGVAVLRLQLNRANALQTSNDPAVITVDTTSTESAAEGIQRLCTVLSGQWRQP